MAIAMSFVAPLIALFLAAILLGERIGRRAVLGALLGFAGVLAIVGGKLWRETLGDGAQARRARGSGVRPLAPSLHAEHGPWMRGV